MLMPNLHYLQVHRIPAMTENKPKKEKRFGYIIAVGLVLIPLLAYLETRVFSIGETRFPVSGNVLVFILINVNVLLLLLAEIYLMLLLLQCSHMHS